LVFDHIGAAAHPEFRARAANDRSRATVFMRRTFLRRFLPPSLPLTGAALAGSPSGDRQPAPALDGFRPPMFRRGFVNVPPVFRRSVVDVP
jgi:hypothetical protein